MAATISDKEHRERKEQAKGRKRRKRRDESAKRKGFAMFHDPPIAPLRVHESKHSHLAQAYQASGDYATAHQLTRDLTGPHKRAVLGASFNTGGVHHARS